MTTTAHVETVVPAELAERLDACATRLNRSHDWIVEQALRDWIGLQEHRHQMTLEALREIDEGKVVDHAEIVA